MLQDDYYREVEAQIARENEAGGWITGGIAVFGLLSFVLDGPAYGFAVLLLIAAINLGVAWEHRRRRARAFERNYGAPGNVRRLSNRMMNEFVKRASGTKQTWVLKARRDKENN